MNLIVGAGLSGCVLAEMIARVMNEEVLLIDKRAHIAGNLYDEERDGIFVHCYGPHIFHTDSQRVWEYVNQFGRFYPYLHKVRGVIDGIEVPLPFNLDSLERLFPQKIADEYIQRLSARFKYGESISILEFRKFEELRPLADFIYSKVFLNYTLKQWGISLEDLDESVARRVPFVFGRGDCYFKDKYQGIPYEGYTKLLSNMLLHPKISLRLGTAYQSLSNEEVRGFKRIFYTGGIDEFFKYCYGRLEYRGIEFEFQTLNQGNFQGTSVINYPNQFDFTRIVEYKYFLPQKQGDNTIISMEYPQAYNGINEQCYPIPSKEQRMLYERYLQKAKEYANLYFLGRLGSYRYLDMDQAIEEAMRVFDQVFWNKK